MESEIPKETSPAVAVSPTVPEKKPFRLNKWHVITVILVAVIAVQGFLYLNLNSSYNTLDAEHQNLKDDYDTLTSQHSTLQNRYSALQSEHNALDDDYDYYVSSYENLRNQVNERTLQSVVKDFITPNDATVKDKVVQVTGGWSNPSDWTEFWSDIKTMYDWVVNNIEYRYDGLSPVLPSSPSGNIEYENEMWQFPKETLNLTRGDCEDMAILLTSMILSYGGTEYEGTECIAITGSTVGHVGVQMLVEGGKLTILDPAGNYYTQTSGNIDSKDISTEVNNWLNYLKPEMGSDVYVDRVFSDELDKSFSSTSEYTTWMYSR